MSGLQKVFYGNICFVCHTTVKEKELKKCSNCKLIFYCSKIHQRIHWKYHRDLCRVIKQIDLILKTENLSNDSEWYEYRTKLLMLCELEVGRKLKSYEMNMILFPNNCQICHKNFDLHPCLKCLCVNYCSEAHEVVDFVSHKEVCHLYKLCLELDLLLEKTHFYPNYFLWNDNFNYLDSIDSFIENNIIISKIDRVSFAQGKALISELITCPLSLLYALHVIKFAFKENLIVHVVGSSFLETASLKSWEIILHVLPSIQKLVIHFIGPEVKELSDNNFCSQCESKLSFNFFSEFYHDYVTRSWAKKPDIICSYNCGFHEFENSDKDTWNKTLPLLVQNEKMPLMFTSFTESEAKRDSELLIRIKKKLNVKIMKNKFCSLRPYRDLENLGVYFNNEYISLVSNSSSN